MVNILNEKNFEEEVLKEKGRVLVDFYADWCGPCKMMSPIIDSIAEEMRDVKFGKVNVDENPELAEKFEIMSIPTIVIIENGQVKQTLIGLRDKNAIEQALQ